MYKKMGETVVNSGGCSSPQLLKGLISLKPAIAYVAYTKR